MMNPIIGIDHYYTEKKAFDRGDRRPYTNQL